MPKIKLSGEFIICEDCSGKERLGKKPGEQIIAFKKLHKKCGQPKQDEIDNHHCRCETPDLLGKPFVGYGEITYDYCHMCKHNRILK